MTDLRNDVEYYLTVEGLTLTDEEIAKLIAILRHETSLYGPTRSKVSVIARLLTKIPDPKFLIQLVTTPTYYHNMMISNYRRVANDFPEWLDDARPILHRHIDFSKWTLPWDRLPLLPEWLMKYRGYASPDSKSNKFFRGLNKLNNFYHLAETEEREALILFPEYDLTEGDVLALLAWVADKRGRIEVEDMLDFVKQRQKHRIAVNRKRDRLAQRRPRWAISEYQGQFKLGRTLAPLYTRVIAELQRAWQAKQRHVKYRDTKFVVHGRDGEMIYLLAAKLAPELYKSMIYLLTPRALLNYDRTEDYDNYLARMLDKSIPQVHVDTGFMGTVPMWFKDRGWNVRNILLVSSSVAERALLKESYGSGPEAERLREIVNDELEHVPQRLVTISGSDKEPLSRDAKWGAWPYSKDAPGFWARYYGVLDGMGIPEEKWRPND